MEKIKFNKERKVTRFFSLVLVLMLLLNVFAPHVGMGSYYAQAAGLSNKKITLVVGETQKITLSGSYKGNWSVDDTSVVKMTVAASKMSATFKGLCSGTANLTVTDSKGNEYTCTIVVKFKIDKQALDLNINKSTYLYTADKTCKAVWTSSDPEIVEVEDDLPTAKCKITALKPGKATITATDDNGGTATCKVNVEKPGFEFEKESFEYTIKDESEFGTKKVVKIKNGGGEVTDILSSKAEVADIYDWNDNSMTLELNGVGTTRITAENEYGMKIRCTVTVKFGDFKLNLTDYTFKDLKGTVDLKAISGTIESAKSSDTKVATVTATKTDGVFTIKPVGYGKASITCKSTNGQTATVNVVVDAYGSASEVTVESAKTVKVGERSKISVTVKDAQHETLQGITYKSSDESVATVDTYGYVTGIKPGSAVVTVTLSNGKTYKCQITVPNKSPATALILTSDSITTYETCKIAAPVKPLNEYEEITNATWKSENPKIATIDSKGMITGVRAGRTNMSCTLSNGISYYFEVVVRYNISMNSTLWVTHGFTKWAPIKAKGNKEKGLEGATFTSSNPKIATVNQKGQIRGIKQGTCTITLKLKTGRKLNCKVTVKPNIYVGYNESKIDPNTYSYGDIYVFIKTAKYVGGYLQLDVIVLNNTSFTISRFNSLQMEVTDNAGNKIASYTARNSTLNAGSGAKKVLSFKIPVDKKYEIRNKGLELYYKYNCQQANG